MKKSSVLLAIAIMMSALTPVFAESELERVVSDVKSRIEIADYENFDTSYYDNTNGERVYTLSWGNNSSENFEFVEVSYSDGFIRNYSISKTTERDRENKFPKITIAEAEEIAKAFSDKVNPLYKDSIRVIGKEASQLGSKAYFFNLQRFEQGFPVRNQAGSIRIDNATGEVISYNMNYNTKTTFPTVGEPIEKEDALSAYKAFLAPKLQYGSYYEYETKKNTVFLEYISNEGNMRIDALSGEAVALPTEYEAYTDGVMEDSANNKEMSAGGSSLSLAEIDEIERIASLYTEQEAEKRARECELIGLSDEYTLQSIRLYTQYNDNEKYVYNLTFTDGDGNINVGIAAKDGKIVSFSKKGEYIKDYKHNTDSEKALAEKAFLTLASERWEEYTLTENQNGSVVFTRLVNGVEVSFDKAYFSFDDLGELVGYSISYTENAEFPKPDGIMTASEIADTISAEYDFSPMFQIDGENNSALLFYTMMKDFAEITFTVSPYTAKPIDYKGEAVEKTARQGIEYSDIDGHWIEKQAKKLAEYGVGFLGGKLLADNSIAQKELVELLGIAFNNTTNYEYAVERLLEERVIDRESYKETEPLTRESAAIIFIKMLGAEEYAKFDDIYFMPFADVTEYKGYIALLKALKVVSGDADGSFYPDKLLTRAETLSMIYNYLAR